MLLIQIDIHPFVGRTPNSSGAAGEGGTYKDGGLVGWEGSGALGLESGI